MVVGAMRKVQLPMATRRLAYPFAEAHPKYGPVILERIRGLAASALSGATSVVDLSSAQSHTSYIIGSSELPPRLHW